MKKLLERTVSECEKYKKDGKVASYIPELSKADPEDLGVALITKDGELYSVGDSEKRFTMQSVIKPIILLLALIDKGEEAVRQIVGVEATGKPFDAFNYSDRALTKEHINPMINAGAIALITLIDGADYEEKFSRLLSITRRLAKNESIDINTDVYRSECLTGNKNRALAYMLKSYGLIDGDVDRIVDIYFRACSIEACACDLAKIGRIFACHGTDPASGEVYFDKKYARMVNAILAICGMYDGSGEFALQAGIPAKSGVGGGIMAVVPGSMGIGVYSPALNKNGNSCAGLKVLEYLSRELDLGVF